MREIVKVWSQGQSKATCIVIPKKMAEKLGITTGCFVELILEDGEIRLRVI